MTYRLTVLLRLANGASAEWAGTLAAHFKLAEAARHAVDRALTAHPSAVAITALTVEPPAATA
jgi:hypothetical protein